MHGFCCALTAEERAREQKRIYSVAGVFFELVSVRTFAWQQTSSSHVLSDFIQLFMNDKSKQARLPVDPRTIVNLENRVITPTKLTIGLKTNILGVVETDFKTEVEYTRDYSVSTLIFVEGENADIIRENNSGVFFFDPEVERLQEFVP
ncbi:hypothetical protein EBQ74_03735 [bacterium]|nr:hypothetical protein [bacterium]